MTPRTLLAAALCLLAVGCLGRPIQQTTITHLREQEAIVMAPELPVGMGAPLGLGTASLSGTAGLTGVQGGDSTLGQQVIPVTALLRGASAASEGLELTASGSLGSPDVDPGPLARGVIGASGVLGRGTVGLRTFLPMKGMVDWGWSFDVGAEASHLRQTDTTVISITDPWGTTRDGFSEEQLSIRVHPHFRTATVVRAPLPLQTPLTALVGLQLQTWPVYWDARTRVDTCTTYRWGETQCSSTGEVDVAPSPLVAVWTPTAGVTLNAAGAQVHLQGFANFGAEGVQAVPWGAMVTLEAITAPARDPRTP